MTLPTKIVVIGAGSASFGENTLSALIRSKKLRGSTLALVDRNEATLDIVKRLAGRLNAEWEAGFTIEAHTHHEAALEGAGFVVSAIEVGAREGLWKMDFEIPLKYGVRQPYAENGGPGRICACSSQYRSSHADCPMTWRELSRRLGLSISPTR